MLPAEFLSDHDAALTRRTKEMRALITRFKVLDSDDLTVRAYTELKNALEAELAELVKGIFLEGMTAGWEEWHAQKRLRQAMEEE
jgi:hypothetical protein